jgi:hypothetical protein
MNNGNGSREFEEEGQEFVLLKRVGDVEVGKGRDEVDEISGGDDDACLLFFHEVVHVFLESL